MGAAAVLEQSDLVIAAALKPVRIIEIRDHRRAIYHATRQRLFQLANMLQRGGETVHENARSHKRLIIRLAHVRPIGADQIDVLTRL